jgi:hypothetical protein
LVAYADESPCTRSVCTVVWQGGTREGSPYADKVISIVSARKYSLRVRDDFSAVSMRRREGILLR